MVPTHFYPHSVNKQFKLQIYICLTLYVDIVWCRFKVKFNFPKTTPTRYSEMIHNVHGIRVYYCSLFVHHWLMTSAVVAHSVFSVMAWLLLSGIFMLGQLLLKYLYSIRQMNQYILNSLLDSEIGFSLYHTGRLKSNGAN